MFSEHLFYSFYEHISSYLPIEFYFKTVYKATSYRPQLYSLKKFQGRFVQKAPNQTTD